MLTLASKPYLDNLPCKRLHLGTIAMLNGSSSLCSDDALGGDACVVPVLEVCCRPVCMEHVFCDRLDYM
jgi:hypothetical protein